MKLKRSVQWMGWIGLSMAILNCSGEAPQDLGVSEGKLKPCPEKPNCVCSQSLSEQHRIEPIPFGKDFHDARLHLQRVLDRLPEATLIDDSGPYFRYEFKSKWLGFVDDVEFFFDEKAKLIHFRSASRLGYSDWNVNRKRMERIRLLYSGH